jgi:DNA ligase-1
MTLFADVARLAEQLAGEGSRLKKRAAIAHALVTVATRPGSEVPDPGHPNLISAYIEAGRFCQYLAGQPFAEADPRKLNVGGALLTRAVREVSGCSDAALTAAYRRHGDLGTAAYDLVALNEPVAKSAGAEGLTIPVEEADAPGSLTLTRVAATFATMAEARTTAARFAAVEDLLRGAGPLETKYLLKLMLGDMRIGVKQSLIEEAIAVAASADVVAVRHAVMLEADLSRAAAMAFAGTLAEARMRLFHPLGFMLASPVDSPEEAVARFTEKPSAVAAGKKTKEVVAKNDESDVEAEADQTGRAATWRDGVEALSGISMAEVRVHDNSPKPAELSALAQTQQDAIHLAPDETEQPPQEAWQVVQQPQGPDLGLQAFIEDKYDGMRAQVHCGDPAQPGRVTLYSRNREEITHSFPEIAEAFRDVREPLILDGEILGWDPAAERALPFSVLGQRIGRKKVDNALRRQIPVVFMAFDLLFEADELLLPLPLRDRRARLEAVVDRLQHVVHAAIDYDHGHATGQVGLFAELEAMREPPVSRLRLSPARLVESAEAIDQAYADARARANEGVMLKAAGSAYLPGRRGLAWVKLKRELATLDVVITGAEFGHGRRAGLLSDYTFAVRGSDGELLNVGKAYSGVTDAEIAELTRWLRAHTVEDQGHFRTVEPLRVLEVAFNNVMRSDRHASGFALRFPRILRIRDDKPVEEIDTLERVEEIFQSQPDKGSE